MCIIFFQIPTLRSSRYALIIASNRDEFFARPARLARRWSSPTGLIAGEDRTEGKEGGTWFGFNSKTGSAAALLNLRLLAEEKAVDRSLLKSRGFFVKKYLEDGGLGMALEEAEYSPFDFFAFEGRKDEDGMRYRSWRVDNLSREGWLEIDGGGVQGFSNTLPEKEYQKVIQGREMFESILNKNQNDSKQLSDQLLGLLRNTEPNFPDPQLRSRFGSERFPDEILKKVAAIRVELPEYGTRTSTVLLVERSGRYLFREMSWDTQPVSDTVLEGVVGE